MSFESASKVFLDCNGMVHYGFLPQSRSVNKEYQVEVIRRLCEANPRKRVVLWRNQSWILHNDNAPAYTSMLVLEFLTTNKSVIMLRPSYSPDLAPAFFFFLFPKLKSTVKEKRFATIEVIETGAVGNNKKYVSEEFRSLEKTLA